MLAQIDQTLTLFLNGSHSLFLDGMAVTATQTFTWMPLALVLLYVLVRNNDLPSIFGLVLCIAVSIFVADQVASSICKPLFERFRPTNDPLIMYSVDVVNGYRGGKYGFFSSHAANTMAVATFISLLMRHRCLSLWLYSWALLNCWTRVYLGVHYVGDLLVGMLWGLFVGWAVYRLWIRFRPRSATDRQAFTSVRLNAYTEGGYAVSGIHLLIAAVAATYLFILFKALFFA